MREGARERGREGEGGSEGAREGGREGLGPSDLQNPLDPIPLLGSLSLTLCPKIAHKNWI